MTVAANELTWSKTKAGALRDCQRKFHFLTSSEENPLKRLKNRYLWSGSFVHEAVGDILKLVRQSAELPSDGKILETARTKMRDEFRVSKLNEGARLFEHEYDVRVDPKVWKSQWETVERSLNWFLSSKWLARFKTLPPESWKAVDELVSFDVDGVKAFVKIDCGLEIDGRFIIIDWKTSALRPGDEFSLLLAGLYAHEVWGADAENTDAFAVSLQDGRQMKASINEESLMETFMKIQDESGMIGQEIERQRGLSFRQIPMTPDVQQCDRCNFRRLCYAG